MNNFFTVKVKYTKQLDNGTLKRVTEPYLVHALSFTDAEARIYEELDSIVRGEFIVQGIARTELHDVFMYDDADVFYKCKVKYQSVDCDSEKAKKVTQIFLVTADSVAQAHERIKESLSGLMVDFSIPSIVVSPIVDIFPLKETKCKKPLVESGEIMVFNVEDQNEIVNRYSLYMMVEASDLKEEDFLSDDFKEWAKTQANDLITFKEN